MTEELDKPDLVDPPCKKQRTAQVSERHPTVVVLGDTGAGKSSLLNALLKELLIVPTSGIRACTAAIIELSAHNLDGYVSEVEFVSRDEWQREEEELFAALTDETGQLILERPVENSEGHDAYWQLRSVYGQALWDALCMRTREAKVTKPQEMVAELLQRPSSSKDVADWLPSQLPAQLGASASASCLKEDICWQVLSSMSDQELEEVLGINDASARMQLAAAVHQINTRTQAHAVLNMVGKKVRVSTPTAHKLHSLIKPYVDSADEGGAASMWPLVRRVVVRGPWTQLIGQTVLVDAPGVQDENSSRGKMVQSYLKQADAVWLVSNIRRAVNDKSTKDMMPPALRQRLLNEGRPGALAFVATQTDVLVRSEIIENLSLPKKSSIERCAIERNAYTKRRLILDFYSGGLDYEPHPAAAAQRAEAEKHSGPVCVGKDGSRLGGAAGQDDDVVEVIEGPSKSTSTPTATTPAPFFRQLLPPGSGTSGRSSGGPKQTPLSNYLPPSHKSVEEAALQGTKHPASILQEVMRMLSTQEQALGGKRHSSSSKPGRDSNAKTGTGSAGGRDVLKEGLEHLREAMAVCKKAEEAFKKEGFVFPCFTVSAIDGQKLEGVRTADGPTSAFTRVEDTDLPALRAHAISLGLDDHIARQQRLIEGCLKATKSLSEALGAALRPHKATSSSPASEIASKLEPALQSAQNCEACLAAVRQHLDQRQSQRSVAEDKPGQWMYDAVEALKAHRAAEDQPP